MARSVLDTARRLLSKRQFPKVISLLEPLVIEYRDSFSFFYMLGLACLYVGDTQGADSYFKSARRIKMNDVNLILAQAVLFLKRGAIDKALDYCLDALDLEPSNKNAQKFLDLIKKYGDKDTISEWNHNGKLKVFYPELPKVFPVKPILVGLFVVILGIGVFFWVKNSIKLDNRGDLSDFVLTVAEKSNPVENTSATSVYRYILTEDEVNRIYNDAKKFYNEYNDNEAQKCINVILNSNASASIRQKARSLMEYLEEPVFDTDLEAYSYSEISKDLLLYQDCWVIWKGRITNVKSSEFYTDADLLVGYEDMKKIDGIAPLRISAEIPVNPEKPLKVLAKISVKDDKLLLEGKAVYQPLTGNKL